MDLNQSCDNQPLLPQGTITFLLTDIEGSTRHWEEAPEAMREALAEHDALAIQIVERRQGHLVKSRGEGDSLFLVFLRPDQALHAAIELQIALRGRSWPTPRSLRVRMALHVGEADLREGDYYGPAVNRCARLRTLARGGQILLSAAVYQRIEGLLPPEVLLHDAGVHRLKDLQEPEHVYEVLHPDLKHLREIQGMAVTIPNNLPRQLNTFIGRERQIAEVKALLQSSCLLTLTGSGGCGKTRLAHQIAIDVMENYPDGVWLAEMAAISEPALTARAVASALNVREEPGRPLMQTLEVHLRHQSVLLVMDNCEHLLAACAVLAEQLLKSCPSLRVLTTSREPLNISGETAYRVPSLALPNKGPLTAANGSPESLARFESVRLFVDRAAAVSPAFALNQVNAPTVARICERLDGIPLAIELAAARIKSLQPEQIAERLDDRFRLLSAGSRNAMPRHSTLRALIDWSYDLLSEVERELFHRVSIFVGGFTLEAAEAVCADSGPPGRTKERTKDSRPRIEVPGLAIPRYEILDLLALLVDKSLVIAEDQEGRVRYRMLETLRQYGREKLALSEVEESIRRRHLTYFLEMALEAERKLRGSEQILWLQRLDLEHDNLRAALSWDALSDADVSAGLRLAAALWWFWHVRGHFSEGREWLGEKLDRTSERNGDRARALHAAGVLARNQGDYSAARAYSYESLEIKREMEDKQGIASSLNNLGTLALSQGDYAGAQPFYEESLKIEKSLGNRQGITASQVGLANIALEQGDYSTAMRYYAECLRIKRELGDQRGIAAALMGLGNTALYQADLAGARDPLAESLLLRRHLGDRRGIATSLQYLALLEIASDHIEQADTLLKEELMIRQDLGDKYGIANALVSQAMIALRQNRIQEAHLHLKQGLLIYREQENRRGIVSALCGYAYLAAAEQETARSARLLVASEALRSVIGCPLHPLERREWNRHVSHIRSSLGEQAFLTATEWGWTMPQENAIEYAVT